VVATADLHRRDYFKPDFFNGIGQEYAFGNSQLDVSIARKAVI
jgi:hypothetical protein